MKYFRNGSSIIISCSCISRCNYYVTNRSKLQHNILRPCRGRRSYSIPTSFLIFRTPRSIYYYSSWIRNCISNCKWSCSKTSIWSSWNDLRNGKYWIIRIYCMRSPYVYSRYGCRYSSLLHCCYNDYCRSNRN